MIQEKNEAESKMVELNLELKNKMSSISDLESRLEIKSSKSPIPVTGKYFIMFFEQAYGSFQMSHLI